MVFFFFGAVTTFCFCFLCPRTFDHLARCAAAIRARAAVDRGLRILAFWRESPLREASATSSCSMTLDEFRQSLTATEPPAGLTHAVIGKRKVALLGLSFKADTDDLRESPQVQLVKQLLAEGRDVTVWDENVLLGRLVASNREYIESTIPHIAGLLCESLDDAIRDAEIVILATRAVQRDELQTRLRPD
jgi:hypothetical protein